MAVTAKWYGNALVQALSGNPLTWAASTIKVQLHTSAYVPDQDAHVFKTSLTNEVITGGGYTQNTKVLVNKILSYDSPTNKIKLDADDVLWAASTIIARYAVLYHDTGTAGTSTLLGYVDFGQDYASSNGDFKLTWDTLGVFNLTVGA